ncbi:MAG: DUF1737 domain-containing protein [Deferribacteraceae bacterium]|jgi:hypothetical protein|nr:DUF1737 domain-containing protein [Deferribacteraceae bacterium]
MKIVDYFILRGAYIENLVTIVHEKLAEGWLPLGGVSVCYEGENEGVYFYQAVVKYEVGVADAKME